MHISIEANGIFGVKIKRDENATKKFFVMNGKFSGRSFYINFNEPQSLYYD